MHPRMDMDLAVTDHPALAGLILYASAMGMDAARRRQSWKEANMFAWSDLSLAKLLDRRAQRTHSSTKVLACLLSVRHPALPCPVVSCPTLLWPYRRPSHDLT